jgi:hypothetical protein
VQPPDADGHGVSTATVRERTAPGSVAPAGPIAPPAGWPGEVWTFPWRGSGALRWTLVLAVFAAVDALAGWNAFVGWAAKLAALLYLVRLQIRVVATSATGRDETPAVGVDGSWEEFFGPALRFLLVALVTLLPAFVAWTLPMVLPMVVQGTPGTLLAVLVAAPLLYLPPVLLGAAFGDLSMKWPHRALPWLARGLPACLLVAAGWVVLVLVEVAIAATMPWGSGMRFLAHLALRAASLYGVAVGGRALGVVGRRYGG